MCYAPLLQNDMMKYFREDLHRRLLSTDFKKQVDGLEMLQKVFPNYILVKSYLVELCEYFLISIFSK